MWGSLDVSVATGCSQPPIRISTFEALPSAWHVWRCIVLVPGAEARPQVEALPMMSAPQPATPRRAGSWQLIAWLKPSYLISLFSLRGDLPKRISASKIVLLVAAVGRVPGYAVGRSVMSDR
jgi:hypothetical protein